jgi:hypothetical protein
MVTIPRLLLPRTNERASPHVRYCIADILDRRIRGNKDGDIGFSLPQLEARLFPIARMVG